MRRATDNKVTQAVARDNLAALAVASKRPDASRAAGSETDCAVKASGEEGERP